MAPLTARGSSSVTYGAELTFETLVDVAGQDATLRVHSEADALIRVVAGSVLLTVDGADRLLATGDEAIVPAGAPHRLANAGREARLIMGLRRPRP